MHEKVARRTAGDFLRRLIAAVPYRVHTVLTDNGTHFTTPEQYELGGWTTRPPWRLESSFGRTLYFEYACAQNDVDHRLTKLQASLDQWSKSKE